VRGLLKVLRRVGCEYHGAQLAPVATGSSGGCRRTATPEAMKRGRARGAGRSALVAFDIDVKRVKR
jgi:hypothetical protein